MTQGLLHKSSFTLIGYKPLSCSYTCGPKRITICTYMYFFSIICSNLKIFVILSYEKEYIYIRNDVILGARLRSDVSCFHMINRFGTFNTLSRAVVAETQQYSKNGNMRVSVKACKITSTSRCH